MIEQETLLRLIDVELWNRARWNGVVYAIPSGGAPVLGLLFDNADIGQQIMARLFSTLNFIDRDEALRIEIIEGERFGRGPGYSVHVSLNAGLFKTIPESELRSIRRIHRMPLSPDLALFKKAFAEHGRYHVTVAKLGPGGHILLNHYDAIEKRLLIMRDASIVTRTGDLDSVNFVRPDRRPSGRPPTQIY